MIFYQPPPSSTALAVDEGGYGWRHGFSRGESILLRVKIFYL